MVVNLVNGYNFGQRNFPITENEALGWGVDGVRGQVGGYAILGAPQLASFGKFTKNLRAA